ncbi:MAG: bifunctional oligoribonuclease/PAP phosphatase NrnA [Fidelibacterota bacterium]
MSESVKGSTGNSRLRWRPVDDLIKKAQRILCSTHVNPDGDGLGSQLAIYHFLKGMGKECQILNPSPLPEDYQFLSEYSRFGTYDPSRDADWVKHADLAIIFDIGDYSRLETLGRDLRVFGVPILSIDHHPHPVAGGTGSDGFAWAVHDDSACATGYLVHEYIKYSARRMGRADGLSPEIATGLYLAIMTDTGSFRFSNTSAEAHEMASELIRHGVDPSRVYEQVYESGPLERIRLMVAALETVRVDGEAGLAWFMVTREMMEKSGAKPEHAGGFTDTVRSIKGVEVAVMIREASSGECKINFRSKGRIRIDDLARRLGGGGHPYAAGAVLSLPLEQAVKRVVSICREEILSQLEKGKTK